MPEWDETIKHFMTCWFTGLMSGLESVDDSAQQAILRECGKACAQSYTAAVFQEARKQSVDLDAFLIALAARFPEATYELLTPCTIQVRYSSCACDLVRQGWVQSPLICECSAHNLRENFERALGLPVTVTLETSILRGATDCLFTVALEKSP